MKEEFDVNSFLSSRQLAEALGVSQKTVERMRRSGRIPAYKLMSKYRYDLDEVKAALIARRKRPPKPQTAQMENTQ